MITVVNKKTHKKTPNDIYIGRPEILGNPYSVTMGRELCIEKYKKYFEQEMVDNDAFNREVFAIAHKAASNDVFLVCWCAPLPCHGEIIKEAVEKILAGGY